jgi:hypothetical protein
LSSHYFVHQLDSETNNINNTCHLNRVSSMSCNVAMMWRVATSGYAGV